jgi:hypothetical protein
MLLCWKQVVVEMRLRDSKVAKLLCKDCEIDELFKYMQDDGVRLLMGSSNIAAAKKKKRRYKWVPQV